MITSSTPPTLTRFSYYQSSTGKKLTYRYIGTTWFPRGSKHTFERTIQRNGEEERVLKHVKLDDPWLNTLTVVEL